MSERNQELQIFLDRASVIKERYRQVNRDNEFNIFSILRKEHDEVGLHSRFIYELLNPKGVHYQEDKFLRIFLDHIGMEYDENELKKYKVEREYRIGSSQNDDQYNNLDILMSYGDKAYIIENKIYAEERIDQLDNYYQEVKRKFSATKVVFLTLLDHELNEEELEEKLEGNFIHLNYREQVRDWLTECIKETAQKPLLREALVMYKNLVLKLTGQSYSEEMIREMEELIMKDRKSLENAVLIEDSLPKVRIEIHKKFWNELEDKLKRKYELKTENHTDKASDSTIADYDKYSNKEIGLPYLVKAEKQGKIIFWITGNKNYGMAYSFILIDNENNHITKEKMNETWEVMWREVRKAANKLQDYSEDRYCPANKWARENLKFTFNVNEINNDEFKLVDDYSRKEFITKIAQEVYKDIESFKIAFE